MGELTMTILNIFPPPPPPPVPPTSSFRCECISRSRLTESVTNPATLYDACHMSYTPVSININKLRTQDFAIFASNRLSAFLKHSNLVEIKGNYSTESQREEREIFIVYKWVN